MKIAELIRLRWLLGTLLIAAAALFAVGIATEGDTHHESVAIVETGERNEATEQAAPNEQSEVPETGERILGINLESTPLVVLALIISVALAAATWRRNHRLILLVAALFAAAFGVLDVAEFSHPSVLGESDRVLDHRGYVSHIGTHACRRPRRSARTAG